MCRNVALLLAVGFVAQNIFCAEFDWPQWQGPERTAHSKETGLLKEWPKDGPPVAWTIKGLGGGDSTPSIAAGRIYGMSNRGADEYVWALSEKDGKEIWAVKIAPAHRTAFHQSKEGPSATPTVDGDRLYVVGLAGNVVCLQASDGKIVWQRNMKTDFGGRSPMWDFRESPLVDGDKVICTPGGEQVTMAALNKLTGETIWKSFVPDRVGGGGGGMQNRPRGDRPNVIQTDLLLSSLDKDKNNEISTDELAVAPAALLKLDKNNDAKISEDEVTAAGGGGGPGGQRRRFGPGVMRMMKAHSALDANSDGGIDADEIKNAVATLKGLDENRDGKLTENEAGMKSMGQQNTGAAYSSAIAIDFGGKHQYVQFLATTVAGVDAGDGKLLWRYDKPANNMRINISTPIYHDGHVFAAAAYGAGGGLARLVKQPTGEIAAEEVWFSKSMENHHGGVILHDGALYGANGGNGGGYPASLDFKTGEVLWNEREKRRLTKGSVVYADGRIYYRAEEGAIVLIEPNRKELIERGRFMQPDRTDKPAWAHPVVANGKLYIRDQDTLYCYDVKAK